MTERDIGGSRSADVSADLPDLGTIRQIYELAEVANARSIRAAARNLKISENTLRRHIDALEQRLGEALLERSKRGVALTDAGHHIVATGLAMQEAYHSNYRLSNKRQRRPAAGTLRLGATDGLATYWLMPHLAQYQRENPQLNVQLLVDLGIEERSYGASDISIRLSATNLGERSQRDALGHAVEIVGASRPPPRRDVYAKQCAEMIMEGTGPLTRNTDARFQCATHGKAKPGHARLVRYCPECVEALAARRAFRPAASASFASTALMVARASGVLKPDTGSEARGAQSVEPLFSDE